MAVLTLLLQQNTDARSIPSWLLWSPGITPGPGQRFLVVPYHLIGAISLESSVLGHYATVVRQLHPGGAHAELLPCRAPVRRRASAARHHGGRGVLCPAWR